MPSTTTDAGLPFYFLQPNDCIGDSLGYFNSNLNNLLTLVNTLSSNVYTLNASLSTNLQSTSPGMAKAWVSFNGSGSILKSYNVTNVIRNSIGDYTINFTGVTDNNYVINAMSKSYTTQSAVLQLKADTTPSIGSFRLINSITANYTNPVDSDYNYVTIFSN